MSEIKSLTALRGIAAMAVVLQHFSATAQLHCAVTIPSLAPHGYMAVDFFFVLSGFIMSYTYLESFQAQGLRAFPDFLRRRVARIVPLNVAVLLALVLCAGISVAFIGRNIFFSSKNLAFDLPANLLMLQGIGIGTNLNGPSWSISTEFAAYLLFPLLTFVVFHRRLKVCILGFVVSVGVLCWVASWQPRLGLDTETIEGQVLRCFTEFVMGMCAYRLYRARLWVRFMGSDLAAFALSALCGSMLLLRLDLPVAIAFPLVVIAFGYNQNRCSRWLSSGIPYFLGVVSYSIYLIHNAFRPLELEVLRALHPAPLSAVSALTFALLGSLSVIPFSWLTYRLIEKPSRTLLRQAKVKNLATTS